MAELVTKQNIIELFQWFANQTDQRYILETVRASANTKGGIKIGDGLYMEGDTLNCNVTLSGGGDGVSYILQPASESELGGIRPGTGVSMRGSYLDLTPADTNNLGGVKVGDGLTMDAQNRLNVVQGATIPSATKTTTGGIKVGEGLDIVDGYLKVTLTGGDSSGDGIIPGHGLTKNGMYLDVTPANKSQLGGIKVGEGLEMNTETEKLNVIPATKNSIGGIIPGYGLAMDGEFLNVTFSGGSGVESDFVGATAYLNGKSGLVPAPNHGDQNKFLRGDGTWHTINQSSGGLSYGTADVEGALWQDVVGDTPCLKFRYGEYEYNFFGERKLSDDATAASTLPLDTSPGQAYKLSQEVSTVDGGLWYELRDEKPTLKFRKGS